MLYILEEMLLGKKLITIMSKFGVVVGPIFKHVDKHI
jgi:hypothetical protein